MRAHPQEHPLAGATINLAAGDFRGLPYTVEDWWDRIADKSWMHCNGNPACLEYAVRSGLDAKPIDNEVVYGKIGGRGYLMHVSDLPEAELA